MQIAAPFSPTSWCAWLELRAHSERETRVSLGLTPEYVPPLALHTIGARPDDEHVD